MVIFKDLTNSYTGILTNTMELSSSLITAALCQPWNEMRAAIPAGRCSEDGSMQKYWLEGKSEDLSRQTGE